MFTFSPLIGRGVVTIEGGSSPPVTSEIPLSFEDSRFATNSPESTYFTYTNPLSTSHTFSNKDWDSRPTMWVSDPDPDADSLGNECVRLNFSSGMDVIANQCRVFWREGWRVSGEGPASLTLNECYSQVLGIIHPITNEDHPDGLQNFGAGDVTITANKCVFRSCDDATSATQIEPPVSGGVTACGSDAFRWADNAYGTLIFNNVVIQGGGRGVSVYADQLTTTIEFENVYFVDDYPGSWNFYRLAIGKRNTGTIVIGKWINVREATIVDGELIPGDDLPSPVGHTFTSATDGSGDFSF